jgi:hypothetical protein
LVIAVVLGAGGCAVTGLSGFGSSDIDAAPWIVASGQWLVAREIEVFSDH